MPDNGIFCVLLVFWNAHERRWRRRRRRREAAWETHNRKGSERERECIAQNQFARNIFSWFLFLHAYLLIYAHIIYTSKSSLFFIYFHIAARRCCTSLEQYAKKEAHIREREWLYWSNCILCFKALETLSITIIMVLADSVGRHGHVSTLMNKCYMQIVNVIGSIGCAACLQYIIYSTCV